MARIFNGDTLIWATSRNSSLSHSVSATASIDFLYAAPEREREKEYYILREHYVVLRGILPVAVS